MSDEHTHRPKLDGSVNLPTLVAIIVAVLGQGLLPSGSTDLEAHASHPHEGAVPLVQYELEQRHDRETLKRIENKVEALGSSLDAHNARHQPD